MLMGAAGARPVAGDGSIAAPTGKEVALQYPRPLGPPATPAMTLMARERDTCGLWCRSHSM